MQSRIKEALNLKYEPVALILTDDRPEKARQFKEGRWGCVMFMLAAAARGETAVFDRKTFACPGGGVGLGFGDQYKNFLGGEEGFCRFLSVGSEDYAPGREMAEQLKPVLRKEMYDNFMYGERYIKSPELVKKFIEALPIIDVPTEYVMFQPLKNVDPEAARPEAIIFLADMDQIAALTILANYGRGHNENVIYPYCAGCQSIGIYPMAEAKRELPRAVLGLNDISARLAVKRALKEDLMTFAPPLALFEEMEGNVAGSFLERHTWKSLRALSSD